MVKITNDIITAEISELGAELRRLIVNGEDRLWSGDPNWWANVAPVLFPICGGLREDKFTFEGVTYDLQKHGFAKLMEFKVERLGKSYATFLLESTEETLKCFPWEFEFRITYTLVANRVEVKYDIKNLSDKTMYMSVGSHEGYACPEGIEDYDVIFEREENLEAAVVDGKLIRRETDTILKNGKVLPLYEKYFDIDALVFTDVKSRFVTLRNRKTGKSVSVSFPDRDFLLLWTKPGAPYICIEPWAGIPSYIDEELDITVKTGINSVLPDTHFVSVHNIYF